MSTGRRGARAADPVARALTTYRAKRDFASSPEPRGAASPRARAARTRPYFCVQKHLASHLHYDFRLEHRGVLLSWAVPKGPSLDPADKRLAMRVEDHPFDYGDFEGVIPSGYGAGIVMLWDHGRWEPVTEDVDAALAKGELRFRLDGFKLKGEWLLVRGRRGDDDRGWILIKRHDEWAGEVAITEFAPLSVKSGGDLADILAADDPAIWESGRPAKGGATGALLGEIITEAARRKAARAARPAAKRRAGAPARGGRARKAPARRG